MLRVAFHRSPPRYRRDRVFQIHGGIGGAALLATVSVLILRFATRAGATHVAVGKEHFLLGIVGLPDGAHRDRAGFLQTAVDVLRVIAVLLRVRGVEVVQRDRERGDVAPVLLEHRIDERFGRDAVFPRLEHDRRAVRVVRADIEAIVSPRALKAHPDIGLDALDEEAEMQRPVRIGQRVRHQHLAPPTVHVAGSFLVA